MREASASNPSDSIAPPPTGSASVSISSCFDDEELLTRLCHPEIAPHAIATNKMGQMGPRIPCGSLRNGPAGSLIVTFVKGVASAPTMIKMIAAGAGKYARRVGGWLKVGFGRIAARCSVSDQKRVETS